MKFPLIGYLNIVSGVPSTGHGQIGSCILLYLFFFKSSFWMLLLVKSYKFVQNQCKTLAIPQCCQMTSKTNLNMSCHLVVALKPKVGAVF